MSTATFSHGGQGSSWWSHIPGDGSLEGKALVLCKIRGGLSIKCSLEDQDDGANLVQVWRRRKWSLDMRERRRKETGRVSFISDGMWNPLTQGTYLPHVLWGPDFSQEEIKSELTLL